MENSPNLTKRVTL